MSRMFYLATVAILLAGSVRAEPILLCGANRVFVIDTTTAVNGKIDKSWVWDARQRDDLPKAVRGAFGTTDDCKPVDGGRRVLVSASSSGCALVERPSGKVIWYAQVANAHSLELLPRDRIVVASSVSPKGNRLVLFDVARSNQPIWSAPLPSAHGVVWDAQRQVLWALGFDELRCYSLKDWESPKPSLELKTTYPLPDKDGHDLQPIPQSSELVVTVGHHVHFFDRDKHTFRPHPVLGNRMNVKSVNVHNVGGRTAFIQATESWWSDTLELLEPTAKIRLPGERLYKARWLQ